LHNTTFGPDAIAKKWGGIGQILPRTVDLIGGLQRAGALPGDKSIGAMARSELGIYFVFTP